MDIRLCMLHEHRRSGGFVGTPHRHDFCEIGVVLEGSCEWRIRSKASVSLTQGDVIWVPDQVWHFERTLSPVRLAWIGVSGFCSPFDIPALKAVALGSDWDAAVWLLNFIYHEQAGQRRCSADLCRLAIGQFLTLVQAAGASPRRTPPDGKRQLPEHQMRMVRSVAAHLEQNPDSPISLKEAAQYHRISPRHLSLLFQKGMGMRPTEYRQRSRIERAKTLLLDGRHRIKEVANACGFADASHFCKAFRIATGRSPVEWQMIEFSCE